jgi:hypothetical protein
MGEEAGNKELDGARPEVPESVLTLRDHLSRELGPKHFFSRPEEGDPKRADWEDKTRAEWEKRVRPERFFKEVEVALDEVEIAELPQAEQVLQIKRMLTYRYQDPITDYEAWVM